jgi:predicted nucleic acid-binding protein
MEKPPLSPSPQTLLLFDASAIVNLLISKGSVGLDIARGNDILDLTVYEAGNALWKLSVLHRKISSAEADSLLSALLRTGLDRMNLVRVSELDHASILNLARTERVSYYDASYVHAAIERKRDLVTDDLRLSRIASKFVSVKGSTGLPLTPSRE